MRKAMRIASVHRRGSIYITVMGVAALVMVTGLGVLVAGRAQARTASNANDFAEARLAARSGIELAMLAIYNDPYWRTHLGNGQWYANQAVGNGTFGLTAKDPVDGDVTNGENDPVLLTATGMKGNAKYMMSVRMEVSPRVGSCLEVSMCTGGNIATQNAALTSDQTISSNAQVTAGGSSTVNANVEAGRSIGGSTYTKATKVTGLKRTMPDPASAMDYYVANATVIPYAALTKSNSTELIANEKFETDVLGWYAMGGCLVKRSSSTYKEGFSSLRCTSRTSSAAAAATDLAVSSLVKGHSYSLNFPVSSAVICTMHVALTIVTDAGTFTFSTPDVVLSAASTWQNLTGTLTPTWTGAISQATVSVYSSSASKDYFIDGLSFKDTTYPGNIYVMDGQLLSPTVNPYGSPNAKGLYLIDCGTKTVVVGNSRIVGTLIFRNPGGNCGVQGAMCMEAAAPNFPALLSDSTISISLDSPPLNETALGVNFNPAGAPYPFSAGTGTYTNTSAADTYPSAITGLVYSAGDLIVDTNSTINGIVIAGGKAQVNATSLTLKYNSTYLNNPPPGFTLGTIQMKPVPGTWGRVAN